MDIVKAGEQFAHAYLGNADQFSNRWFLVGQSQGGGAAIYTARYATQFGGPSLDYVGAVGTGVPALEENLIELLGPETPVSVVSGDLTAYFTWLLDSLEVWQPQLNIQSVLTATGKTFLAEGDTLCAFPLIDAEAKVNISQFFTVPLASLPGFETTLDTYMKMPETGFDKPFFISAGLTDTDVPYNLTQAYVATLSANRQPVTFRTYPGDHSATLIASQGPDGPVHREADQGGRSRSGGEHGAADDDPVGAEDDAHLRFTSRRHPPHHRPGPEHDQGDRPAVQATTGTHHRRDLVDSTDNGDPLAASHAAAPR